ncbi:hypothetical protein ACWDY4_25880 [Streptomyces olivaceoviridis]
MERPSAAAAADRRATLAILDDDALVDLLVLSYLPTAPRAACGQTPSLGSPRTS